MILGEESSALLNDGRDAPRRVEERIDLVTPAQSGMYESE